MSIILASGSIRRKELLEQIGIDFIVQKVDCDENICSKDPKICVGLLAGKKAGKVLNNIDTVIAADTLVVCDGEFMGKPKDREDAKRMLLKLSGKKHSVFTGYVVAKGAKAEGGAEETVVTFAEIDDQEIERYLDTNEYKDKAGGYAIQGIAGKFITKIDGSYANVVGLPIHKIYEALKILGEIE